MSVDFTGGLSVDREYVFSEPPVTEGMRDAINSWMWDDSGEIGFPRAAVESVAPRWDVHDMLLSVVFPGGRVLRNRDPGPAHAVTGPDGKATIFGAGPMSFECIEPYRRHRTTFKGSAIDTTFEALLRGPQDDTRRVSLEYDIECEIAAPPWVQGEMSSEAADMLSLALEGGFMGGERYEQLFRAKGFVRIDGKERPFSGGGLRIRRRGVRNVTGFWGHCWQSALFPSGRGFGYIAYPPREDGRPSYNEGFLYMGEGALIPARVVEAPWLTEFQSGGEDVSLVLESKLGRTRIEGQSVSGAPTTTLSVFSGFPPLQQSIVRYSWDGEQAHGMMERSNLKERIKGLG